MERRLLLVFALTFLVIVLFQPMLKKYLPAAACARSRNPRVKPRRCRQAGCHRSGPGRATADPGAAMPALPSRPPPNPKPSLRTIFTASPSPTAAAQVKSWILKKFNDDKGQPLELVNNAAAEKYGYPLSLWTYDETQRNKLNSALYVASSFGHGERPRPKSPSNTPTGMWPSARPSASTTPTWCTSKPRSSPKAARSLPSPRGPPASETRSRSPAYAASRIEYQYNSDIERLAIKNVSGGNTLPRALQLGGRDRSVLRRGLHSRRSAELRHWSRCATRIDIPKDPQSPNSAGYAPRRTSWARPSATPGARRLQRMYVGPKAAAHSGNRARRQPSSGADPDLRGLVNFGFFGVIARPLFLWLQWTYKHTSATGVGRSSSRP